MRSAAATRPAIRKGADYGQAMAVALGFYLFGHLADLGATLGGLEYGLEAGGLLPGLALCQGGVWALVTVKVLGALGTAWVFWKLRGRAVALALACVLALVLLYVASINLLEVLEAAARARALGA